MTSSSQEVALIIDSEASTYIKPTTMPMDKDSLNLLIEPAVDFGSLTRNACDIQPYTDRQNWSNYFNMLNGPSYTELVKDLWVRAEAYDEEVAHREEYEKILEDMSLEGKIREEMGLKELTGVEIRYAVMGIKVTITEVMISRITCCRDNGLYFIGTEKLIKTSEWVSRIHKILFEGRDFKKCNHLRKEHRVLQKLMIMCFMPREGGTYYMSWDQKHFLLFLVKKCPINLPAYIFNHMCTSIREGIIGNKIVPYTRLISKILYHGRLFQKLQDLGVTSHEELGTWTGKVVNGTMLGFMKIIRKKNVIISKDDLKLSVKTTEFLDDFPPISL